MKIQEKCLPCMVNQIIRVVNITNADNREELYRNIFSYMSEMDYNKTSPETMGACYAILKKHIGNDDPFYEIRKYYNELLLGMSDEMEASIQNAKDSFFQAMKYAVIGNIIDFSLTTNRTTEQILEFFQKAEKYHFTIDKSKELLEEVKRTKTLLYLGDNCGEICLDKLFLKKIKEVNPDIKIYFAVRGEAVMNDSIEEDAYFVGIDKYADIISNGDNSMGTAIERTSEEFQKIYKKADFIISKGQANYECLSDVKDKKIFFLLMAKCEVISKVIGVEENALICMENKC